MNKTVIGDYAVNWKLSVPASLKDQFVTVEDLSKSDLLIGSLNIYVYFQPNNKYYMLVPAKPAGVYSYNVTMTRLGDVVADTKNTVYPFVSRFDGPVELQEFFGY